MATVLRRLFAVALIFSTVTGGAIASDADAVRAALAEATACLAQGDAAKAVTLLERQLGRLPSDPALKASYYAAMKDAYRSYLKALQSDNRFDLYELYRKRLAVIDKAPSETPVAPVQREIVRGIRTDDDPFQQQPLNEAAPTDPFTAARQAFAARNYPAARLAFDRARETGAKFTSELNSQYSYCLLSEVVGRLNSGSARRSEIERDVKAALSLVPDDAKITAFGRQVLQEARQLPDGPPATGTPAMAVRHADAGQGWTRSESQNFRLTHTQDRGYAEKFLAAAEQHRVATFAKWGPTQPSGWTPTCEIYLHATGDNYAKATKQAATSPGHSSIKVAGGKVTGRRIDLRADNSDLSAVTLPHEITHVVLADLFADVTLPRWADEGMAVLSEPRQQVDRYLKTMVRLRTEGRLVPLAQIMNQTEYPDAASVTVFYVESVSVVEFLVNRRGPAAFVAFLRDAHTGMGPALQKHYGIKDVPSLQDQWLRATFTEVDRLARANSAE